MKTFEQILSELIADPQHITMTKQVDGQSLPMTETERLEILNEWAAAEYEKQIKKWANVESFMAEFTMEELAAISLSTDPTIAALRMVLMTWLSKVHSDDDRVNAGLVRLIELGIITEQRKQAILSI